MPYQAADYWPKRDARVAGLFYALIMVGGYYAEGGVRSSIFVSSDVAATAHNILSNELFYRSGIAVQIAVLICDAIVAVLLFNILRPVNKTLSLTAAVCRIIFISILAASAVFWFAPLYLLDNPSNSGSLSVSDAQVLTSIALRLYTKGFQAGLVFFGLHIFLIGILIVRSTFLPRLLGLLLSLAGIGYVMFAFINILALPVADTDIYLLLLGFVAELSLTVWLCIRGLNLDKWHAVASGVQD